MILVNVVVSFGLAILGWGGISPFFAHTPLIALALATAALTIAAFFAGGGMSSGEREDRANRWVLVAFGLILLSDSFLPAYADRKDFWTLDGDAVRWAGVVVFILGGALRLWPVFILGRQFSGLVAIQPGHKLISRGPYRVIRHPSYLGMLINLLGWALAFRSGVGILMMAMIVPPLIARIRSEERLLSTQFGNEYADYRARTSRLIPGLY